MAADGEAVVNEDELLVADVEEYSVPTVMVLVTLFAGFFKTAGGTGMGDVRDGSELVKEPDIPSILGFHASMRQWETKIIRIRTRRVETTKYKGCC
jgi:hypothetical protein